MSIIYHLFDTHSCPEDRGSAWINIWHSEVPEIPSEYFPGASGRSWTVALTTVRLCSQPRWSRCTHPSSPSTCCSPMHISSNMSIDWRAKKERTLLACVSLRAGHALSFLVTRWNTTACAFRTRRSVGCIQDVDCIYIAPTEHGGKGEIVWLRKKDVGDVLLLS